MGFAKRLFIFLLIILLLGFFSYYYPYLESSLTGNIVNNEGTSYQSEKAFVIRVIDGDTIETDVGTIRFLGINTPEKKKPYYQEAKDFLIDEVENKSVELLRDYTDEDKYNRKLRYLFYDNRLINVEIVEQGFATTFMLDELKYKDKFVNAEKFARESGVGLWTKSHNVCANCIKLVKLEHNPPEYFIIKNDCSFDCSLDGWEVKDDANHFFGLDYLPSREEKKYETKTGTEVWNDAGDRFFMRDDKGKLVVFYEY